MKILEEWNPSIHTIAKAKMVRQMNIEGLSIRKIAKKIGHHFTYVHQLNLLAKELEKKNEK